MVSGGLLISCATAAWAAPATEPDTLPVPPVPAVEAKGKPDLPMVPAFEVPVAIDGVHEVRELRVRSPALLGTELTVRGYITWIYDCAKALATQGVRRVETQLMIDDNPNLCERPKFHLAGSPDAAPDVALWVMDVPRPPNKREQIALTRAQIAARPLYPTISVGDFVEVTGTFTRQSPYGEQSSDGLLVYKRLQHVAPRAPVSAAAPEPSAAPEGRVEPVAKLEPPLRVVVPVRDRNASIEAYEVCNQALTDGDATKAIAECRRAVAAWRGNHLAWYALGNALAASEDWRGARAAYDHAVRARPDAAMYQLYDGIASYEVAVRQAAEDRARQQRHAPDSVAEAVRAIEQDSSTRNLVLKPYRLAMALSGTTTATFDHARRSLSNAARRAPSLWLASYDLGLLARAEDHPRAAAEAFMRAIAADPSQPEPYVALGKLYRAWDYNVESLAIALQAHAQVTAGASASLTYELGLAYEATHRDADALAAFSKAVAAGHAGAAFQRGQMYLRAGDLVSARRDLEAFLASPVPLPAFEAQVARSLLRTIDRKEHESHMYLRVPRHIEGPHGGE